MSLLYKPPETPTLCTFAPARCFHLEVFKLRFVLVLHLLGVGHRALGRIAVIVEIGAVRSVADGGNDWALVFAAVKVFPVNGFEEGILLDQGASADASLGDIAQAG